MRALFIAALVSVTVAGSASAASMARLQQGRQERAALVLDGRVWRCDGVVCTAAGQGRSQGLVRECARLARRLGPLSAYGREGASLGVAGLDRCNREARASRGAVRL